MLGRFPRMEIIQREETDKFLIWNDLGKPPPTEHVTHAHAFSLESTQFQLMSGLTRGKKRGVKKLFSWFKLKQFYLSKKLTLSRPLWELNIRESPLLMSHQIRDDERFVSA